MEHHDIYMNRSLRVWFWVHFLVDYIVAIPLFLFPLQTLSFLGWGTIDPFATRVVAAALFAIGGISLAVRNADQNIYRYLLTFKIVWSFTATISFVSAIIQGGAPWGIWAAMIVFAFFGSVWIYYRLRL